jgi:endogenous inhibitor of DNA gyrase (YacG/DUF329 family)
MESILQKIVRNLKDPFHSPTILRWTLGWFRSKAKSYCPICGTAGRFSFSAAGNPRRPNAQCPTCGSAERHRFIYLCLQNAWNIGETGKLQKRGGGGVIYCI